MNEFANGLRKTCVSLALGMPVKIISGKLEKLSVNIPILLLFIICIVLPSCSKNESPKGDWILDCGMVEHSDGDYHMVHQMTLDLDRPTIPVEDEENDGTKLTYGTYDFSTMDRVYQGYIDSVTRVSENVYVLHSVDTGWGYTSTDTLRYYPEKDAFSFGFGSDMLFVKEGSVSAENTVGSSPVSERRNNSSLVIWIVIIAAILLVLCIGIKFSGEYDGWEFAIPITAALAVLISIVGYNIVFQDKIPGQLQISSSDGATALLWLYGSMLIIAVSYFWGINIIRRGLADEGYYFSIGCGTWVMVLLMINVFAGMATDFQSFRDISSDFIGSISFKRDLVSGLLACTLALAFLLTIIQIIQFYKKLSPLVATVATVLFPLYVIGGVAMCCSCIPMLIMAIIVYLAVLFFFHGTSSAFKAAAEAASMPEPVNRHSPDEIEFFESGSAVRTSAQRYMGDIYITSDGRKFIKEGDQVKPYEP